MIPDPDEILKSVEEQKKIIKQHCRQGNISMSHKRINIDILKLYDTVERSMMEIKKLENKKKGIGYLGDY